MLGENGQNVELERDLLFGCFHCPGDAYEQSDARKHGPRDGEAQHNVNSILCDGAPTRGSTGVRESQVIEPYGCPAAATRSFSMDSAKGTVEWRFVHLEEREKMADKNEYAQ